MSHFTTGQPLLLTGKGSSQHFARHIGEKQSCLETSISKIQNIKEVHEERRQEGRETEREREGHKESRKEMEGRKEGKKEGKRGGGGEVGWLAQGDLGRPTEEDVDYPGTDSSLNLLF